jgi:DNA-binding IclR family transcriptional regulator
MARPALSASRAAVILDLLAAYPEREFSMAEISRLTKINTASCHAILSVLASQGHLARSDDEKRYTLGIALIAIGHAASVAHPIIARAQAAAEKLSDKLGVSMLLSTVVDDEILGLAVRVGPSGVGLGIQPGQRFPLAAPAGAHFMAWAAEEEIEAWIARAGNPSPDEISAWRDALSLVCRRGYQVTLAEPVAAEFSEVMMELALGKRSLAFKENAQRLVTAHALHLKQPTAIEPNERYPVNAIASPIFDRDGHAILSIGIGGFGRQITGLEIKDFATDLLQTCINIMTEDRAGQEN